MCGLGSKDNREKSAQGSIPCTTSWYIDVKISYIEKSGCTRLEMVLKIRNATDKSGPGDAPAHHRLHCTQRWG